MGNADSRTRQRYGYTSAKSVFTSSKVAQPLQRIPSSANHSSLSFSNSDDVDVYGTDDDYFEQCMDG